MVRDIKYDDISIGDTASISKTITEYDVYCFAGLNGDFNPIHVNSEFASTSIFKERIVHGMLAASFISAVFGTTLPGRNTIYLKQDLVFKAPVKIGDTITATVEAIKKNIPKKQITFKTSVTKQNGIIAIDGQAVVMKKD